MIAARQAAARLIAVVRWQLNSSPPASDSIDTQFLHLQTCAPQRNVFGVAILPPASNHCLQWLRKNTIDRFKTNQKS
jgi:hypothetical protein